MKYKTKAQELSFLSRKYAVNKSKQEWLSLFAEDAVVEDPIGISPLDTTGEGHAGKKAIEAFYDNVIANGDLIFEIIESIPCGDECANYANITNKIDDIEITTKMIVTYRVNSNDKIVSLRAFWDYQSMEDQITQAFSKGD
tara:strand:- start:199 stop:621 length:423 start_codon:yes stop_codon:yes gene_type:complete